MLFHLALKIKSVERETHLGFGIWKLGFFVKDYLSFFSGNLYNL